MPKPNKALETKEFAEQQLKEIRRINDRIKRKTRKLILVAFMTNLALLGLMFLFIWFMNK